MMGTSKAREWLEAHRDYPHEHWCLIWPFARDRREGRAVQRIYRLANGYGLSAINSPMAHSYPFAWEFAVVTGLRDDGKYDRLAYSTPLTEDVEVFDSDEEANAFIQRAIKELGTHQ